MACIELTSEIHWAASWLEYQYRIDSNSDNLPVDFLHIPLSRIGIPDSAWGSGDIRQFEIAVKLKASFGSSTFTRLVGWLSYTPVSKPEPRGAVILDTLLNPPTPVAGWNKVSDLPVASLVSLTRMVFNNSAISHIKLSIGDREVYNMTKAAAIAALAFNPLYKMWSTLAAASTFPCFLEVLGTPGEYVPLVQDGVRRPVNLEYFWDTTITATPAAFEILIEGVEPGQPQPTANAA